MRLPALSKATAEAYYRPRIVSFVAAPSQSAAERPGLVLLSSAGSGHRFHDPTGSTRGYAGRDGWTINTGMSRLDRLAVR